MRHRPDLCAWTLVLALLFIGRITAQPSAARLTPVPRSSLCVTEGSIESLTGDRLSVNLPKMRAYVNASTPPTVEAQFTYLGSTGNELPLGSGEIRRQFGLKLRAQDACNLVYAMWRVEPESKLVVSIKTNPGQHTSAQCANRGYQNIKPARATPVPVLHPGQSHTLRAEMRGAEMTVLADNTVVWQGSLGPQALTFDGPVGMRSDNARLQVQLRTAPPLKAAAPGCRTGADASE